MTQAPDAAHSQNLYGHPVAAALLDEALALLGDGVPAAAVEEASTQAALPTGALSILDSISLEVVDHALHDELHALEHAHEHGAAHDHAHGHVHDHSCGHEHGHGSTAPHDHGYGHAHDHDHGHAHDNARGHGRDHTETHTHAAAPAPLPTPTVKARPHVHKAKSQRMVESAVYVVEKMAHGYRRMGRAAGAGFYDYTSNPPALWSGLKTFERRSRKVPAEDVLDRLRYAAILRALTLDAAPTAAFAQAFGTQVPGDAAAALRSPLAADATAFLARCSELADRYGPRFAPSDAQLARLPAGER